MFNLSKNINDFEPIKRKKVSKLLTVQRMNIICSINEQF
tara:strand:- start:231 stop:347 length:117 start_codon:yes stop_codon:yes gene_type:complete